MSLPPPWTPCASALTIADKHKDEVRIPLHSRKAGLFGTIYYRPHKVHYIAFWIGLWSLY